MITALSFPLLLLSAGLVGDSDWTRFRGNEGSGVFSQRTFPETWSDEENVAWTAEVPGSGWSSPIVLGDRVFRTTAVHPGVELGRGMSDGLRSPMTRGSGGEKPTIEVTFQVRCHSLTDGSQLWSKDIEKLVPEYSIHPSNTYATSTPTTDGERLFVTFGALGKVLCFDLDGKQLWSVDTGVFPTGNDFGWGISLVCLDDRVFVQNDNEESSFLAAFDTESGEEVWRAERDKGTSWGTPVLWNTESGTQLVALGSNSAISYEPATGKPIWTVQGFGGSFSSSPAFDSNNLYFGNSGPRRKGPLIAVPSTAKGTIDLASSEEAPITWSIKKAGPGFPSPISSGRYVYVLGSPGILGCYDTESGEEVYRERLPDAATIVASPWIVGDELHIMDESGATFVVRVGEEYELLRTNRLEGTFWSTPSIAGKSLLVREGEKLICVRAAE